MNDRSDPRADSSAGSAIEREAEIFAAASDRPPAERAAFLDAACAGYPALRARLEALLAADSEVERPLDAPALERLRGLALGGAMPERPERPERIGAFRILGCLGEGGMGVVYEAEQDHPSRRVALKVVRSGLVSESLLRRFEHEARILGWLNHPGIAQIFEAGCAETASGPQAYFAMELVRGSTPTRYADEQRLDTAARLELVAKVCDAIQHAHQKGVIHRDLKPGNVLVEAGGQPKVLDFGVARATDADLQATTLQTATGELVGTLAYMSPEQVAGRAEEVDTRADVYALGVIAHELLGGAPPLDLRGKLIHEAARAILEDEPSTLGALDASLRGDVETIVAKALAKEKERRYASAEELARDIRRYLRSEPIVARPASATYQLRKFAQRNKALVGGALVALLALAAGTVTSTVLWLRAEDARERAVREQRAADAARTEERNQKELAQGALQRATQAETQALAAADRANREAGIANQVKDFLVELFNGANPLQSRGREVTLGDVLERGTQAVVADVEQDPRVRAEVMSTIALTYQGLGRAVDALPLMESAAALGRGIDDPEFVDAKLRILRRLGRLYVDLERMDDALAQLEEARAFAREHFGADHPMELRVRSNIGLVLRQQGRIREAFETFQRVDELARRQHLDEGEGPEIHDFVRTNRYYLAGTKSELGDPQGAIEDLADLVDFYEGRDRPDDPALIPILATLAEERMYLGQQEEARALALRGLRIVEQQLGPDSVQALGPLTMLARLDGIAARPQESEAWALRAYEILRGARRLENREAGFVLMLLSDAHTAMGDYGRALDELLEVLALYDRILEPDHPSRGDAAERLTDLLVAAAREPVPGEATVDELLERAASWLHERGREREADALFQAREAAAR